MKTPRFAAHLIKTDTQISEVVWNSWFSLKVHLDVLLSEENITEATHNQMFELLMDLKSLVQDAMDEAEAYERNESEERSKCCNEIYE